MTNNDIIKIITMLDNNEQDKAREFLKTQLVKSTDKKGYNLLSLVKKYLKAVGKTRPVLTMVQHNKDGQQFILDGFTAMKFKQHETTLDILPQADASQSVNLEAIFDTYSQYTLTEDDTIILNNIDKCIDLIMADKTDKKDKKCFVYLFNKFYNLYVIKNIIQIALSYDEDFSNTKFTQNNELYNMTQIENDNIKAVILPCRIVNEDEQNKIKDNTQKIIELIKGE